MIQIGPQPGVVIIGGGHAGIQAAASARAADPDVPIMVLAAEPELPYQRPPLSKTLLDHKPDACRLPLRPASYFSDRRIDLRRATPVMGLIANGAWCS